MSNDSLKIHRELTIDLGSESPPAVLASLEQHAQTPWRRELTMEQHLASDGPDKMYCFSRADDGRLRAANLWLIHKGDQLAVSNIIPIHVGSLDVAAYNALLEDFSRAVVAPTTEELGIAPAKLTAGEVTLEEWLGPATASKLRAFSAFANKATRASHPKDQRRWNDFVYTSHREGCEIDADRLQEWLIQDGWLDSEAYELAVQYEQARALLDFARENTLHAAR